MRKPYICIPFVESITWLKLLCHGHSCLYSCYITALDNMPGHLSFKRMKTYESLSQFKPRLKLLSVQWSEDGFSHAACIDGLDSQKAGKRKGKETEGRLVQQTKS